MKSRPYIYAIIAGILIILILGGSIWYYYTTIHEDEPTPSSNNSNLFGTSTSNQNGVPSGYTGSNSFNNSYVTETTPEPTGQGLAPITTGRAYVFSQPFTVYRAPVQANETPFVADGKPEQVQQNTATQTDAGSEDSIYTYGTLYNRSTGTTTLVRVTATRQPQNDDEEDDGNAVEQFHELDQQVFGYVTGLGWTQYLGSIGQMAFDSIYGFTPQGSTGNTAGGLLGGALGGAGGGLLGGGGFGGAGGGAQQNFGGMVTRITYCTCQASTMLDISDVRGQSISLIYTPGATTLYSNFNVNTPGVNVLGNYTPGASCLVYHGEECSSEGNPQGNITIMGTSE